MMQRYSSAWQQKRYDGEWVKYSDAEAEIRAAIQRERQEIIKNLSAFESKNRHHGGSEWEGGFHQGIEQSRDRILARGEEKPFVCGCHIKFECDASTCGCDCHKKPSKIARLDPYDYD